MDQRRTGGDAIWNAMMRHSAADHEDLSNTPQGSIGWVCVTVEHGHERVAIAVIQVGDRTTSRSLR
jgi:hypothetical protein